MRRLLPTRRLLLAATFLTPLSAGAATIEASSSLSQITVHTDGARISRKIAVDVPAGAYTIAVRGLPAGLDPASLRVTGEGSAALSIVSVDSRVVPGDAKPVVDAELEGRLERLRAERDTLAGTIEAADVQRNAIQLYAQASPEKLGTEGKPLDIDRWADAWRTLGRGLADINGQLRTLRDQAKTLDGEIAALERARPLPARPGAPKRDILVAVEAGKALTADLSLTYQVSAARWTPLYDARLQTAGDKPKLEITRRAALEQRTGEDWAGAAVSLSTVRLRRGTAAPDLASQTLTLVDPLAEAELARPAAKARMAEDRMLTAAPAPPSPSSFASAPAPVPVAATPVFAVVETGAFEATFTIPGAVEVPQDGTVRTFALSARTVEPALGARTVPALDATAYLEASFFAEDDLPVLPGEVMLARDGAFIGKGRFPFTPPGEKVRLGFGADDRIKVLRVPVTRKDNDPSFFGSNRTEIQDFRTNVRNLHAFPIRLAIIDRLPVSENTAIIVTPLATNTPATEKNVEDKRGVLGWSFDYKPGEARDIRFGWQIRWPADRELRRQ